MHVFHRQGLFNIQNMVCRIVTDKKKLSEYREHGPEKWMPQNFVHKIISYDNQYNMKVFQIQYKPMQNMVKTQENKNFFDLNLEQQRA